MMTHLSAVLLTGLLIYSPMSTLTYDALDTQQSTPTSQDVANRITELENEVRLLKAQQALALNATAQQTEAATTEKALVTAQSELLKSQVEQLKLLIPTAPAGLQGSVSGEPSAARGTVQAWIDLNEGFKDVAGKVKTSCGENCTVIVNPPALDDYSTSKWATESLRSVSARLSDRMKTLKDGTPPELLKDVTPTPTTRFSPEVIPALVSPVIESLLGFTKLFRSDRTFSGVAITPGSDSVYNLAAFRLLESNVKVIDVEHFLVPDATFAGQFSKSDLIKNLDDILSKLNEIDTTYYAVANRAKNLEANPQTPKTSFPFYDSAVARWKELSDKLHQALDPIVLAPVPGADSLFLKLLKGAMIENLLSQQNTYLLYLKVEALGGNRVIKKNLWRTDREYESASYVVSYRLVDKNGHVPVAGIVSKNGAFTKMVLP